MINHRKTNKNKIKCQNFFFSETDKDADDSDSLGGS
jgi:hypothetical protein